MRNNIPARVIMTIFLAILIFLSPLVANAADHTRAAVVDESKGTVTATQNEMEMPAFRGLALLRGDRLAAGAESWSRLELNEGQFAIIEENTDIRIEALADGLTDAKTTRVYMSEGKVWFDVSGGLSDGDSFEVNTPTVALTVRGTFFSVTAAGDETTLAVYDGEVALNYDGDAAIPVSSGNKVTIASETGTIPTVTQSGLTPEDMAPLQEGNEEGPGGVYEALRDQMQENEELTRHIEQLHEQVIEQSIEPQTDESTQQAIDQMIDEIIDQTFEALIEQQGEQMIGQAQIDVLTDLIQGGPAFPDTLLNMNEIINEPPPPTPDIGNASITGNLLAGRGNDGTYSFNVNLRSGEISGGTMNGSYGSIITYDLRDGSGSVRGNDFNLGGFRGVVMDTGYPSPLTDVQAVLDGTARNGFGSIGDIGASGTFEIIYGDGTTSYHVNGVIVDGRRER